MTEQKKMRAGQLYDANDPILTQKRLWTKELCYELNALRPSEAAAQTALLRQLLGTMGEDVTILAPFWCDYGEHITVGDHFFANHGLTVLDCAPVVFGDRVFIGPDCGFYTAGHPLDPERRGRGLEYARPIRVGNDVWLGGGVRVLPGVTIGDGCVIGSGSVVTRDIPPHTVAAGNPCRVLRPVTDADRNREY